MNYALTARWTVMISYQGYSVLIGWNYFGVIYAKGLDAVNEPNRVHRTLPVSC